MSDTSALSVLSLDYSAAPDGVYFKPLLAVALETADSRCVLALQPAGMEQQVVLWD